MYGEEGKVQMRDRFLAAILTAIAVASLVAPPVAGQAQKTAADAWTQSRTPDGQPDLQGIWTMATYTPLERPANFAGREFLTEEEAAELSRDLTAEGVDPLARSALAAETDEQRRERLRQSKENIHYDNAVWLTEKRPKGLSSRRTSLIVDPPDGKIPPLTPEAKKREADREKTSSFLVENIAHPSYDSHETRTLQERCLVWRHEGPPMLPPSYNDRLQIIQGPGHVAIFQEMSNNAIRIIPLDGRPHLPPSIRQWPGDSRGRWEGNTLVVDTTNFTHKTHFGGSSEALHVVERFTRVDADTIRYEFTVDDPTSWTRPWKAEIPMMKAEGGLYEYACHEGNHDLSNILGIARNVEKAAAEAAKKTSR
jgi:hypothetical protein